MSGENSASGTEALGVLLLGACLGFVAGVAVTEGKARQKETDAALSRLRIELAALRPKEAPVK